MRILNGLIYIFCVLAMTFSTVNAQMTITIDNQAIPTEHISSIVILPRTNEINISTTVAYEVRQIVEGDGVAITNFNVSLSTVVAGQSISFNWDTSNAVSCEATNGVDGWAGSEITLPSGDKSITTATTGSHTFTLTCNGSAIDDTDTRNLVVNITPVDAVSITTFFATPDAIAVGDTTTLSWSTVNATSCTPTGGTADWTSTNISLPDGSANIVIDTADTYIFNLVCVGPSADQQTKSEVVEVANAPQSCDSVTLAGNTVVWSSFWSASFPGPVYENVTNWIVPQGGYLAIVFDTAGFIDDGKISALENSSSPGIRIGSFSECPGDFNVAEECKYRWGLGGGLRWETNGKNGACPLDSDKTYYFNITFTDGENSNSSNCRATPCRVNLQHVNF